MTKANEADGTVADLGPIPTCGTKKKRKKKKTKAEEVIEYLNIKESSEAREYDKILENTFDSLVHLAVQHREFLNKIGITRDHPDYFKYVDPLIDPLDKAERGIMDMRKVIRRL